MIDKSWLFTAFTIGWIAGVYNILLIKPTVRFLVYLRDLHRNRKAHSMSSEYTWLAIDITPSPPPADWDNPNQWLPCTINGVDRGGRLHIQDQSVTPPKSVAWPDFATDPRNHKYVPLYYGPLQAGQQGSDVTIKAIVSGTPWKWFGTATAKWVVVPPYGYWMVTGMNYETAGYPR